MRRGTRAGAGDRQALTNALLAYVTSARPGSARRHVADELRSLEAPAVSPYVVDALALEGLARRSDVDALLTSVGVAPGQMVAREPMPQARDLTAREVEVLRLVATGKTNREIGAELLLSEHTVKRHLGNVFVKLGTATRAAAAAAALRQELI